MTTRLSIKPPIRALLLTVVLLWGGIGAYVLFLGSTDNFHTVVPGELYRSAQMGPNELASLQKKYGFKTIINLRGNNAGRGWYDSEIAESEKLGIKHIDFGMSAVRQLPFDKTDQLINLLRDSEKPILVHCKSGADRTGLASALYIAALKEGSEREAEQHLSFAYGHFPLFFLGEYNMERSFDQMEPLFGYERPKVQMKGPKS